MSTLPTMTRDVLAYLQERERPLTIAAIASGTKARPATVRKILSRLLRAGVIERMALTGQGRMRTCYRARPTAAALLATILAHHAAERHYLLARCLRLEARVAELEGR